MPSPTLVRSSLRLEPNGASLSRNLSLIVAVGCAVVSTALDDLLRAVRSILYSDDAP